MSCLEQTHVLHASWLDKTQRLIWSVVLGSCPIGEMWSNVLSGADACATC